MSYTFDNMLEKQGKGEINLATTTGLWLRLVMEGSGLTGTGQPSATAFSAVTTLSECNLSGYVKKNLTGLVYAVDTTAHQAKLTFSPVTYTALGSATAQVAGAVVAWGSSTTTGRPLLYFDNSPLFPFSGGRDVVIGALSGGSVKLYG